MDNLNKNWEKVLGKLKSKMIAASYNSWIAPLIPVRADENAHIFTVAAGSDMAQSVINNRYILSLESALSEVFGEQYKLSVILSEELDEVNINNEVVKNNNSAETRINSDISEDEIYLNPRYNFSTFVIGKNNEFAHSAALAVARNPSSAYNPLFLYGDAGLGKTHLMHAIGHYILKNDPSKRVLYVSSEMFTNELIHAVQKNSTMEFHNKYRNIDVLMIDDIQFIENKNSTQEEVFHTFNTLYEANKQIIITSDRPPKELKTLELRLKSRFEWGLIADINPPDFETRVAILKNKAEIEDITVTPELNEVFYLIAESITSNIRELEGALNRLIAHSNLTHKPITKDFAASVLKEVFAIRSKEVNADLIKKTVCEFYGFTVTEIESTKRTRDLASARQIAMYLCRELTEMSLPKIGEAFGGRDHSTVIHSCDKVSNDMKNNEDLDGAVKELIRRIKE